MDDIFNPALSADVSECAEVSVIKAEQTILEAEVRSREARKADLQVYHRQPSPCGLLFDDNDEVNEDLEFAAGRVPELRFCQRFVEVDLGLEDATRLAGLDDDEEPEEQFYYSHLEHPQFSVDIDISTVEGMWEFWGGGGDHSGSYDNAEAEYWGKAARKRQRDWAKLEAQVGRHFSDPRMLFDAGIIGKDELEKINPSRPDLKILDTLMKDEELPEMELTFFEGRLCINDVPTTIKEEDLRDLYNGYQAFNGEKEAIDLVVATVKRLLTQLFRKEEK